MNKDKTYWLRLADRYFDAETSDEEERLLKRFLASEAGQDEAFDEVRAVMGVFVTGKKRAVKKTGRVVSWWKWTAAAAAVAGFAFFLAKMYAPKHSTEICVAYVDGHEITDRKEVLAMMRSSWNNVGYAETPSVEAQLEDMFSCME